MSEFDTTEKIQSAAREVVERGRNIQEEMRDITLKALADGELDSDRIKTVIHAIAEGASSGIDLQGDMLKDAMKQTVNGLDEALAQAAQASKLAIEEAAGHMRDFSQGDMKQALDQLKGLDDMFQETLGEFAKSTQTVTAEVFRDLAAHAQTSGTAVGEQTNEVLSSLTDQMSRSGKEGWLAGVEATRSASADIARMASGFLAGIADALHQQGDTTDDSGDKDS